jgi:hypothetical protein
MSHILFLFFHTFNNKIIKIVILFYNMLFLLIIYFIILFKFNEFIQYTTTTIALLIFVNKI